MAFFGYPADEKKVEMEMKIIAVHTDTTSRPGVDHSVEPCALLGRFLHLPKNGRDEYLGYRRFWFHALGGLVPGGRSARRATPLCG